VTRRQQQALNFIERYIADNGDISPSYDEIGEELGLKSASQVYQCVQSLEGEGLITTRPHFPRSIRIIKPAEARMREALETAPSISAGPVPSIQYVSWYEGARKEALK
jgi:SOS-response transcriptional repressor LexA